MKLIVGLGNPGKEYENTRHNCGFKAIEAYAEMAQVDFNREDFKGRYAHPVESFCTRDLQSDKRSFAISGGFLPYPES